MARETCNLNKEEAEILKPSSPPPASPPAAAPQPSLFLRRRISPAADLASTPPSNSANSSPEIREVQPFTRRCSCCRRKVGLTGFRCRCGDLFCSRHRYSDCHDCSFDYKAAGREEIAKANPEIRASKIIKI